MTGTRMSFDNPAASVPHATGPNRRLRLAVVLLLATALAGCTSLGSSGPPAGAIREAQGTDFAGAEIRVVDLSAEVAQGLSATVRSETFAKVFGDAAPVGTVIGAGDVLDVSVWEAPPAALFGMFGQPAGGAAATDAVLAKETDLPQQMVDVDGLVSLPFIGRLPAAGRTPRQLERDIAARLRGIANQPQVSVGLMRNASANVNVVGKVVTNGRVPLSPRGERLLDVIAVAGGVVERLERTSIQITRDNQVVTMPMDTIVRDPRQNIRLQPDDVVTALYQPYSFTALGAVGLQSEVDFEATGITLSQAMGRINGLQDTRANVKGVFVFRLEDPSRLDPAVVSGARLMPDGTLPVIYRIDLSDPRGVFLMQSFQMHNRDVLYVSNAPGVDLQRFVTILSQVAFSLIGVTNAVAPGN